jgi:uncharacterized protein YhaN
LQNTAKVTSVDELRDAIERSDELRSLQSEREANSAALAQDGDGMSVAELTDECAGADLDQITAREQTINQELASLQGRLIEAGEARSTTRREFETIGGGDRAARAAADKQVALSEMREIAEEYVCLRSAELLLQWAIDRYRREKQAPILNRASELFAILTCGSFEHLQLEFDEHDNAQLAGIRQNGRKVPVYAMSSGSIDQLYLALRVAAVEDFLSHSAPIAARAVPMSISSAASSIAWPKVHARPTSASHRCRCRPACSPICAGGSQKASPASISWNGMGGR